MTNDQPNPGDRPEDHLNISRIESGIDGTLSLRLDGELDPFTAPLLTNALDGDQLDGVTNLDLDVAGLRFLDSSGLRVLVVTHSELDSRGGGVILRGATDNIRRVVEIAGLDTNLTLHD